MHPALYPALFFTVALLVTTAYFLMGGLPLLILKHDVPVDAKFIRGFFNLYYKIATVTALGAACSYAIAGWYGFASAALVVVVLVFVLRRQLIPSMERLAARIQDSDLAAISQFRKIHSAALLINLIQLVLLVWGLTYLKLS